MECRIGPHGKRRQWFGGGRFATRAELRRPSVLRLDDRLQLALGNGMGVNLTPQEVETVARWLVVLRKIAESKIGPGANHIAMQALGELKPA